MFDVLKQFEDLCCASNYSEVFLYHVTPQPGFDSVIEGRNGY